MFGTHQTSTCLDTLGVFNDGTAKGVSEPYSTTICRTVSRRVTFPPSSTQRDRIDSVCFFYLYLLILTNQDITNKTGSTFTCLFIFRWSEFMKAAPSGWSTIYTWQIIVIGTPHCTFTNLYMNTYFKIKKNVAILPACPWCLYRWTVGPKDPYDDVKGLAVDGACAFAFSLQPPAALQDPVYLYPLRPLVLSSLIKNLAWEIHF